VLRRFTLEDVEDLLALTENPSVAREAPEIGTTEAQIRDYINIQQSYQPFEQDKCFDLAVERKEDNRVIGLLTLVTRKHQQGEIGYALGVECRGKGYATEAASALITYGFRSLGLHRIQATTQRGNVDSWQVMERLNMRREGCLRDAVLKDGEWQDSLIYGILASDLREDFR
jgi:RimJ/RimL family protein N-acetyltransferase